MNLARLNTSLPSETVFDNHANNVLRAVKQKKKKAVWCYKIDSFCQRHKFNWGAVVECSRDETSPLPELVSLLLRSLSLETQSTSSEHYPDSGSWLNMYKSGLVWHAGIARLPSNKTQSKCLHSSSLFTVSFTARLSVSQVVGILLEKTAPFHQSIEFVFIIKHLMLHIIYLESKKTAYKRCISACKPRDSSVTENH